MDEKKKRRLPLQTLVELIQYIKITATSLGYSDDSKFVIDMMNETCDEAGWTIKEAHRALIEYRDCFSMINYLPRDPMIN